MKFKSLIEKTTDAYHRLDFAFNNAGIEQAMNPLVQQTVEEYDRIMNTNVRGI
jgi:NADP-dependent 3-hydroxy acid dehydrogenase YdfG